MLSLILHAPAGLQNVNRGAYGDFNHRRSALLVHETVCSARSAWIGLTVNRLLESPASTFSLDVSRFLPFGVLLRDGSDVP